MSTLKLFKIYLLCYFLFPISTLYFALLTGIKIPMWIELVPLFFIVLFKLRFTKLNNSDLLFLILIVNSIVFMALNLGDYSWLGDIEIRAFIFIALNYYIFRSLLNKDWSEDIAEFIIKIIKFSMYFAVLEFLIINNDGVAIVIQDRYLSVFEGSERMYEKILFLTKPIGIFPGTHNLGVASLISILYLVTTKSINTNKSFFIASIFVFFVGFSLTISLSMLIIYSIYIVISSGMTWRMVKNSIYALFLLVFAGFIFQYNEVLSELKAYGEVRGTFSVSDDSVYIKSLLNSFVSLLQNPFGTPLNQIELYDNEVYISRLIIYFGWPIIIFLVLAFFKVVTNLKFQSNSGIFFSLSYLSLFISSFHYGSINYHPLTILVPLTFVLTQYSKNRLSAK